MINRALTPSTFETEAGASIIESQIDDTQTVFDKTWSSGHTQDKLNEKQSLDERTQVITSQNNDNIHYPTNAVGTAQSVAVAEDARIEFQESSTKGVKGKLHWFTDEIASVMREECPEGFKPGRIGWRVK